jgi:hypothetical protein
MGIMKIRLAIVLWGASCGLLASAEGETSGLPRRDALTASRLVSAPHATQAAVADARHVYALSNTTVAQHDRASGRLVRLATEATTKHLNSGFVHEGKIWCAHSNYPALPHESDIRIFDPAMGALSVHHVFPDPPGSLVWCVIRDGRWWCCFAHYGVENGRTVLVEYEAGGFDRERRRFTFPAEVVADWDDMSASGGIWDGDTLLVSHHHFRVLYRLRLPASGTVLEFVEALHCPFPGQGIAADPLTGGLVGIDRSRPAVIFAVWAACQRGDAAGRPAVMAAGCSPSKTVHTGVRSRSRVR